MSKMNTKKLVMVGLFIALQIVFTRMFSIQLPTIRIGFSFLPLAMCAMLFGPVVGGIAAAVADIIGLILFPVGVFFPGFTLTAFLSGVVYGLFMYNKPYKTLNAVAAVVIVCIGFNLFLDTFWLYILYDRGYFAILPGRILRTAVMVPVQIFMLLFFWKYIVLRFRGLFEGGTQVE